MMRRTLALGLAAIAAVASFSVFAAAPTAGAQNEAQNGYGTYCQGPQACYGNTSNVNASAYCQGPQDCPAPAAGTYCQGPQNCYTGTAATTGNGDTASSNQNGYTCAGPRGCRGLAAQR